jgi:polar amino acid transport system permease protein
VSSPHTSGRGAADAELNANDPALVPPSGRGRLLAGHGALTASISTVAFIVLIGVLAVLSPGSHKVQEVFFSPHHFAKSSGPVWHGFVINIKIMVVAEIVVLVLALGIAILRGLPGPAAFPLRALAVVYTDVFRGIPLILVVFIVGLGLPGLQLRWISTQSVFVYGTIALILVYSAYVTEVYRAGIESVHASQVAAARSLGLTHWQTQRHVVLPQAVRRVIPPLLNDFIGLQKDTALVSLLGVVESAREAQDYAATYFNFTGYVVAAVYFVLLTIPLARFTDWLIRRDQRKTRAAAG